MLELLSALEDVSDDDFELDEGVTTTTELAEDAREDLLVVVELLARLELDATEERDDALELKLELELAASELLLVTELNDELATDEGPVGDGCVDSPPPPPPHAVITKTTPITKLALLTKRISHHLHF